MRRLWIDTDTASDDAVAILMALRWPEVYVEGISIVAGNVPVGWEVVTRATRWNFAARRPRFMRALRDLC